MRRGIVLFITLGILMLLASIIFLFLQQSGTLKKSVRKNVAVIQTNLILSDLSGFLKSQNFSQDDLFYGSGIPVSLDLGPISSFLTIDSAQRKINLNAILASVQKDQIAFDTFLDWMERHNVKNPRLMLALLLDTYDTDVYERERGSEIRLNQPWFQNGAIANAKALETILETYRILGNEENLSLRLWKDVFGFEGSTFDLNYATSDQLQLLYPDYPQTTLSKLSAHTERYEKPDDIPIDDEYKMTILQPRFGITPVLSTQTIAISVDFNTTQECSGSMGFWMGMKKKKITHLTLSPILCP
ncbi:hypothetical protein [Hydrogenimonas urashimensis]|uniref:hypothetical protein n=1 Tax=Hydrogenimonas urashimensis TaxID=2740515 RepID=UPI0019153CFE|nr:hypothetical protein [Hydrogenimonas urashimensis]